MTIEQQQGAAIRDGQSRFICSSGAALNRYKAILNYEADRLNSKRQNTFTIDTTTGETRLESNNYGRQLDAVNSDLDVVVELFRSCETCHEGFPFSAPCDEEGNMTPRVDCPLEAREDFELLKLLIDN